MDFVVGDKDRRYALWKLSPEVRYTRTDYDKYQVTDGVRMRCGSAKKDYWGLNQVSVTLVWKFVK